MASRVDFDPSKAVTCVALDLDLGNEEDDERDIGRGIGAVVDPVAGSIVHRFIMTSRGTFEIDELFPFIEKGLHHDASAVAIGIATDRKPQDLMRDDPRFSSLSVPMTFINRFDALALGVAPLQALSCAVICLSGDVGYGMVSDGRAVELDHTQHGTGGLRQVPRLSDHSMLPIANIAGMQQLEVRARCTMGEIFRRAANHDEQMACILNDAIDAAAEVVVDVTRSHGAREIRLMVYEHAYITNEPRRDFVQRIQEAAQHKLNPVACPPIICVEDRSAVDSRLLGAARKAYQYVLDHLSDAPAGFPFLLAPSAACSLQFLR